MARNRTDRQKGGALLLALLAMCCFIAMAMVGTIPTYRSSRLQHTGAALAEAKEALIGYAVAKGNPPGSFPCPDVANSGTAASSCGGNMIGRLPWKTLGLGDLRDADGECLWYALSPAFKNNVATLNLSTHGTLSIARDDGTLVADGILAVVFAPGAPLAGSDRTPTGNTVCAGNGNAASYLDSAGGVSNASGNRNGNTFTFVAAEYSTVFNDQLIYITAADLFPVLNARVAAEIRGGASNGLRQYYGKHANTLPWAASIANGMQQPGLATGYVPYGDPTLIYAGSSWLNDNGWFGLAHYDVTQPNVSRITLDGKDYASAF